MPGLPAGLMDNRTILEKADLALSDLTTGGGMLQPAQAQKFLRIEPARAVATNDGLFDAFTAAQEASATVLLRALASRFGWTREVSAYGHVDFDSPGKEDPGPIWKQTILPRVLDKVFGGGAVASASTTGAAGQGG